MSIANGGRYASVVLEYERVVKDIADKVADGRLRRGDKLAGEKDLAEEYGIEPTQARGLVRRLREKGFLGSTPPGLAGGFATEAALRAAKFVGDLHG